MHDITASKLAEALIRDSEERLRLAIEASQMAMWDWDITTNQVRWNDEHYRMVGYRPGEIEPSYLAWASSVHPDDRAGAEAALLGAMHSRMPYSYEYRHLRPDNTVLWSSARGRFMYDDNGAPKRMIGLMEDVTQRRQLEETQRVLLGEMQHRTRNLIAIVQSIAEQMLGTAETIGSFRDAFNDRLEALSRAQTLLSHTDKRSITIGALVRMELEALGLAHSYASKITLAGPDVQLRRSAVQILALSIHELATNARKYGAFTTNEGQLSISWRVANTENDSQCLVMEWLERGIVPRGESSNPTRRGYGRTLIEEALPYSQSARTRFELTDNYLYCSVSLPLGAMEESEVVG